MMPKTMKAGILVELNQPLRLEEVELPQVLDYGQVLVKVCYSGICGSQLGEISGVKGSDPYLPHLLGHEGSGVVVETGTGVGTVNPGDHVVLHWRKGAGMGSRPPKYLWQGENLNAGFVTTFNEYAVVSENRVTKISNSFDMKIATLFGCAVTTGLGVVNNNAKVKIGESVVVWGAGGVGLSIVQGAAMVSAFPIIAIDLYDNRLKLAKVMGATHTINAGDTDPEQAINEILGERGAHVVIDNTGNTEIIENAYKLTSPKGRTVLVGVPRAGKKASIYTLPLHFEKQLTGSHGGESVPNVDIPKYIRLVDAGKLAIQPLLTDQYRLEEINDAIDDMRSGRVAGRILISLV